MNTPIAISASVAVVRTFVHLRRLLATQEHLARQIAGGTGGTGSDLVFLFLAAQLRVRNQKKPSLTPAPAQVSQLDLNNGTINSLTAKLRSAQQSLTRGNINAATNQLNAFLNEISALKRSRRLTAATADAFFFLVQPILELISS